MIDFESRELREVTIRMAPYGEFDSRFNFYYDETNNIRKFYLKEGGFNASYDNNFVLGGIAYRGDKPNIDGLFDGLNLQASIKEVKLKHIAKGDFLNCLKSDKLTYFLNYLNQNDFYVHYSTINILYFSIVDIIDSALVNSSIQQRNNPQFVMLLKNDLFKLVKLKIDEVIHMFYQYTYPDIKEEDIPSFINDLLFLFKEFKGTPEFRPGLDFIEMILLESLRDNSLPFIMDEKKHMLLEDFFHFYIRPIYLFKNSTHTFDNEESIKEILNGYNLKYNGLPLNTYSFEDSGENKYIQASDIFIGLEGKLSSFINTIPVTEIEQTIDKLENRQKQNLNLYFDLVDKSHSLNPVLIHNISSLDDLRKRAIIDELRKE